MSNRLYRLKNIYLKNGIKGIINHVLFKLKINYRLKNDLDRLKEYFSKTLAEKLEYRIQSGHFKDIKLIFNNNTGIIANRLENLYETEVINEIVKLQTKFNKKYFVEFGVAEGFYVNGLLGKNIFNFSIGFDIDKKLLNLCKKNLISNNVAQNKFKLINQKIDENSFNYFRENNIDLEECFFLIDIEGDELRVLNEKNLYQLRNSLLIIEIHNFLKKEEEFLKLKNNLLNIFEVKKISIGSRHFDEKSFHKTFLRSEIEKNIYCSELRPSGMYWLVCKPKN